MNDQSSLFQYMKSLSVWVLAIGVLGCAQDYGRDTQPDSAIGASSEQKPAPPSTGSSTRETRRLQDTMSGTAHPREDARFVATEEQGVKAWKTSSAPAPISVKNRGSRPVMLKAVNMLSGEHGFAIDTMKVQEIIKPGEEKIISIPIENIDPAISEHRVYCQLHPKHVATTLVVMAEQGQGLDTTKSNSRNQPAETSLRSPATAATPTPAPTTGESDGQRLIREQSEQQRNIESTSNSGQAPSSIAPKSCEGFPGFDRGCPQGGK